MQSESNRRDQNRLTGGTQAADYKSQLDKIPRGYADMTGKNYISHDDYNSAIDALNKGDFDKVSRIINRANSF
jgi:hypothetical protein